MADDSLWQLYDRAAITLQIAYEVNQHLKRDGLAGAGPHLMRLELELATWKPVRTDLNNYLAETADHAAAVAVWRHSGQNRAKPEPPLRPSHVPDPSKLRTILQAVDAIERRLEAFQDTIEHNLGESTFQSDIAVTTEALNFAGIFLDFAKHELERNSVEKSPQPPTPELVELPAEPDALDDLVTLDQVAPLAGLSKRSLERYLSSEELPEPDVRGGGGKANKWYWRSIRPALALIAQRPLPERFPGSRIA